MTKKLRGFLDQIDEMLMDNEEGFQLYAILSALRGPDRPKTHRIKEEFTARIRYQAFAKWGAANHIGLVINTLPFPPYQENKQAWLDAEDVAGGHFMSHVVRAMNALSQQDR